MKLAIVIATYNRYLLLNRLIASIVSQKISVEIIVIDDASCEDYSALPCSVNYIKQSENQGPGVCRNVGLQVSTADWVVIMDDDDYFEANAFASIFAHIEHNVFLNDYPVFQLPRSNGHISENYLLITMSDYINNKISGDFLPIINRELFLKQNYKYPNTRVGGEHLLWWRIALDYGIPTWSSPMICVLGIEAGERLTSPSTQIKRATEHMLLAQDTLQQFGTVLRADFPVQYRSRVMALTTYALLSANKDIAKQAITALKEDKLLSLVFSVLCILPTPILINLFIKYRELSLGRSD